MSAIMDRIVASPVPLPIGRAVEITCRRSERYWRVSAAPAAGDRRDGDALGGGLELAMCGDVLIAGAPARTPARMPP